MNILESLQIAIDGIISNKLRAVLTMLGIIIGVAAVIVMLGIGRGAQASIEAQIQSNGTNLLYVRPGSTQQGGVRQAQGSAQTLTYADAQALAEPGAAPAVAAVAPEYNAFGQVVYQGINANSRVTGVTPEYLSVRLLSLASGDFIDASQVTGRSTVAVLGANVAKTLFQDADPIGQSIRINNISFRVIGVLAAKGGTGFGSLDDQVMVPITTAQLRLAGGGQFRGSNNISVINVQIVDASQNDAAIQQVSQILRERHRITGDDDFSVTSQQDIIQTAANTTGIFTLFLGAIAGISLLVGGIGIMNIMLVSVTERTREIGLRKAVGARRRDVLTQFLVEAMVLSVLGGLIGVALAFGVARLVGGAQFGTFSINPVIGLDSVLMATLFSVAVGLFFGAYPANRAASLNPIEALRYE
ncbi:MAG: ABC transporter permease [Anaerolineae bacterium]|nr:ABC transporter permease [Anaerolineae bacterium]